jgi:hypothetical protein
MSNAHANRREDVLSVIQLICKGKILCRLGDDFWNCQPFFQPGKIFQKIRTTDDRGVPDADGAMAPRAIVCGFGAIEYEAGYQYLPFEHRTSNVQHRRSKVGFAVLSPFINRQNALFDVGRSMFDVGRSDLSFRSRSRSRSRFRFRFRFATVSGLIACSRLPFSQNR